MAGACDNAETVDGDTACNTFRSPFQKRQDVTLIKSTCVSERVSIRFQAEAFNVSNTPRFDAPNTRERHEQRE